MANHAFRLYLDTIQWDRPSLTQQGDIDPNYTYVGVGKVLSRWEKIEIQLGYVYTANDAGIPLPSELQFEWVLDGTALHLGEHSSGFLFGVVPSYR
jgi:hypothetical protein